MNESGAVNIRALQLFISVFDGQSFSAVARREGVSASMISRTVRQLEEALGQQLFYRNTRAVIPNRSRAAIRAVRARHYRAVQRGAARASGPLA
ncbi:DNA-binding transcriptional regulator IlvY [Cronobacter sakazakii]|nr:DNA-binding transcriptional regulator IlvY [Cronobacter sakazakii]